MESDVLMYRFAGLDADEALVAEYTKTLGAKLDAYEAILSKLNYDASNVIVYYISR